MILSRILDSPVITRKRQIIIRSNWELVVICSIAITLILPLKLTIIARGPGLKTYCRDKYHEFSEKTVRKTRREASILHSRAVWPISSCSTYYEKYNDGTTSRSHLLSEISQLNRILSLVFSLTRKLKEIE